jgi:hypothetical protein
MEEFYTPIEKVKEELVKRWNNKELRSKVSQYFNRELPLLLKDSPKAVLFRNIISPDGEFERFYHTAIKNELDPIGLEYTGDKFVTFNEDKFALVNLDFYIGRSTDGSARARARKIVDIPSADGKKLKDIVTFWGEPLSQFHHRYLEKSYPGFAQKLEDVSSWLNYSKGGAKVYYNDLMALFICHGVLFEGFLSSGIESAFTENVFKPAFRRITEHFGVQPLIVELGGDDCSVDPSWWYYKKEQIEVVKQLVQEWKDGKVQ